MDNSNDSVCGHEQPVFGCDGCIARGNQGTDAVPDLRIWRLEFELTKETFEYVAAPNKEAALRIGDETADDVLLHAFDEISIYATESKIQDVEADSAGEKWIMVDGEGMVPLNSVDFYREDSHG